MARPALTTDGNPTPPGIPAVSMPVASSCRTTSAATSMTASGVAGCGVGMRIRSVTSCPLARSTTAALMPVPPMSMPRARPVRRAVGCGTLAYSFAEAGRSLLMLTSIRPQSATFLRGGQHDWGPHE